MKAAKCESCTRKAMDRRKLLDAAKHKAINEAIKRNTEIAIYKESIIGDFLIESAGKIIAAIKSGNKNYRLIEIVSNL